MKKIKIIVLLGVLLSFSAITANAGVTFLPSASGSVGTGKKKTSLSTDQKCKNAGYRLTCSSSQRGVDSCPYNKNYYKSCCSKEYKYTIKECQKAGLSYSRTSCGGLYKCI